ncbi:hypothetical protein [Streptomyces sp. NPDC058739]|uniref:hypothetical protein n=1 Tax=Streptomyces sp. NPDC058739 TaxID=3346618 RepID=UPI0036802476
MTAPSPSPSRPWRALAGGEAALAACAVCWAGPLLAVLGGVGAASAIGALWMPALAVPTLVLAVAFLVVRRRRRAAACRTVPARADLGMPALGPPRQGDGEEALNS